MAIDTDDRAIPIGIRRFLRLRLFELGGALIFTVLIATGISLASWSPDSSSPGNWLGHPGAVLADYLMQLFGLGVLVLIAVPMAWAVTLLGHTGIMRPLRSVVGWMAATTCVAAALAAFPPPAGWALATGLGGSVGEILLGVILLGLSVALTGTVAKLIAATLLAAYAGWLAVRSAGFRQRSIEQRPDRMVLAARKIFKFVHGKVRSLHDSWQQRKYASAPGADILARLAPLRDGKLRIEPRLTGQLDPQIDEPGEVDLEPDEEDTGLTINRDDKPIKQGKRIKKDSQASLKFLKSSEFEFPPLTLLSEPKRIGKAADLSDEALEKNARALEGVLEDFGVKGQIIKVRPGPVVTLYELEPAPGIKSSRVISLADDIARSMSALSARVAVVSGRNAIGIELPNSKRETVYLRELLASEAYEKTNLNLALALGKNIGGEPVFADLARMPHLLIAGTTGSGKSVGINTMILSLLYRLTPAQCKLIMIDPKMLELSVYEGIPHLLSPVVTDPRKAVVALKWAVREMENRYRKMSKLGVRNIDGYNARLKQIAAKGEKLARTVQTGFDSASGEPIFEQEPIDTTLLPYIVVIIDEMADLMMVAGKDIEGAVQRLAQMARAAGIHVVMATQRPSVDVITGTIKANFPTRVSFQVTSKIDSRTILGEQGAEQLLGQGDMLYMAGGGRISRLHSPFVTDDEVEKIVSHLKSQGTPEYVDAVTEEVEEDFSEAALYGEGGGSGDELYDQAVAVVLRDKKVSTSYVQRRLQVGYNKAASLIERMEREGVISAANTTGKREILVPGDSARV